MKKLIFFTTGLLIALTLMGQTPARFKYQAVLRDVRGNIKANTATNISIAILQGSATGTSVYSETHSATTDSYGVINLELGNGTVIAGSISSIDWGTSTYFIKITVDGVEMGTSQLLSVPYALYAAKAANGFSGNYNELTNKPTTLDGYGITDAIKTSHPANGILSTNITNWNDVYSWGNHTGLYKPVEYVPSWGEISSNPFSITAPSDNQLLKYSAGSGKWENWTSSFLTGITSGQIITALGFTPYNSTNPSGYTSNAGTVTSVGMSAPVGFTVSGTPVTTSGTLDLSLTSGYVIPTLSQLFPGFGTTVDKAAYGDHLHSNATISASGFMSGADKTKLNGIDGSETIVNSGTNVTVTGTGSVGNPYVINGTAHTLGEEYEGGIVFFVYEGGQHGLIAAKEDLMGGQYGNDPYFPWFNLYCPEGCYTLESGAKGDGLGAGAMNTTLIVASQVSYNLTNYLGFPMQDFAAKACADYEVTIATTDGDITFGDWYLPSKYELNLLYMSQENITTLNLEPEDYWSSTEEDQFDAWFQNFSDGSQDIASKDIYDMTARVRPIRAF